MSVSPSPRALVATDLVKRYQDRLVLDAVSLVAPPGRRVGLVGENGAGKSTLLRLLAGAEAPDSGTVTRPADLGFLDQELPHPPTARVGAVLDGALAEVRTAEARLSVLADRLAREPDDHETLTAYGETLEWAELHELWDADRRAGLVMAGLGLGDIDHDRAVGTLSGGQRSRLGLAALLLRRPGALLLDEPTNHLDDDAMTFVEDHLTRLPGVVVTASHDRMFLDAVCTDIYDLDTGRAGVTRYGGAYHDYLDAKRDERRRWEEQYTAEQQELKHLRHTIAVTARQVAHHRPATDGDKTAYHFHGAKVERQVSRRVRDARQRLDELDASQVRRPPRPLRFAGALTRARLGDGLAIAVRAIEVPGRLTVPSLDIEPAERLLITGGNGAGKSTLLEVLAGRLVPQAGTVQRRRGLRVELLPQDVAFAEPRRTARALYAETAARIETPVPALVDLGLVAPRDIDRPVSELSVGQRRRVALALLIARTPHVLLLDEPTNHLSLTLVEELEEALRSAPGAIVAASHDRWLRRRWPGPVLDLAGTRGQAVRAADAASTGDTA